MQIAHRIQAGRRGIDGVGHRRRVQFGTDERRDIEPQRPIGNPAKSQRNVNAIAVIVERDLGRGRDKGKVRAPRTDLEEACADAHAAARPET